jgi:undecaprenyl-diphosphatase
MIKGGRMKTTVYACYGWFRSHLEAIQAWDHKWSIWIQEKRQPARDRYMLAITRLGDGGTIWLMIAALFLFRQDGSATALNLFLTVTFSAFIANLILKPLCSRLRPFQANPAQPPLPLTPSDTSFPSGHAMTSFAAATAIWQTSALLGVPGIALAAAIAFSRFYLFLHYPSDIITGALLGILFSAMILV